MNKEEYAQLHYLLAKIKYEEVSTLMSSNISDKAKNIIKDIISAVEKIEKVCILDGSSNE